MSLLNYSRKSIVLLFFSTILYIYYYRDKDSKEIDIVLEDSGKLYPIEIKKTATPQSQLTRVFGVLDKSSLERSTGAILCTTDRLSAFDSDHLIVPIWGI